MGGRRTTQRRAVDERSGRAFGVYGESETRN